MHREELLIHLISVVKSFKTRSPTLPGQAQSPTIPQMDQTVEMSWEEREELLDAAMDEDTMTSLPMDRKTQMLDTSRQVAIPRGGKMVLAATMDTEPRIH